MDPRVAPLAEILRLDTRLVLNCVDGMTDAQLAARPAPPANGVAFLVAHLADTRHALLALLGTAADNPLAPYVASAHGIDDVAALPARAELLDAWRDVAERLDRRLAELDAAALDAPAPQRFPVDDASTLGAVAFLVQHDAFHVGQLALLRRIHGLPAMRYGAPRPAADAGAPGA